MTQRALTAEWQRIESAIGHTPIGSARRVGVMLGGDRVSAETGLVRAGDGWVEVPAGSPAALALDPGRVAEDEFAQVAAGQMQWSLGSELADLLWMTVPESRGLLAALVISELATAERRDRFLMPLSLWDVIDVVYTDLLEPAFADLAAQADVARRTLAALRRQMQTSTDELVRQAIDEKVVRPRPSGELVEDVRPVPGWMGPTVTIEAPPRRRADRRGQEGLEGGDNLLQRKAETANVVKVGDDAAENLPPPGTGQQTQSLELRGRKGCRWQRFGQKAYRPRPSGKSLRLAASDA